MLQPANHRPRLARLLRVAAWALGALVVVAGVAVYLALRTMDRWDREHARFLATGSSINGFLEQYAKAVRAGDVRRFYGDRYMSRGRGRWELRPAGASSGIERWALLVSGTQDARAPERLDEFAAYRAGLERVDDVKCKIDEIERIGPGGAVVMRVKYILDGVDRRGRTFQDRFFYRWSLVNTSASPGRFDWSIARDELIEGVRVGGDGRGFLAVEPGSIGIDFRHRRDPKLRPDGPGRRPKFGVIEHAFGGIAACDYDNDFRVDLFVADGLRCRLYRNVTEPGEPLPRFEDATDASGLGAIDQASSGLFFDADNDGRKDLLVVRYLAPNRFFRQVAPGRFRDDSRASGLSLDAPSVAVTALDYDRDGYLDLYLGIYGDAFEAIPRLPFFARNAPPNVLYHNDGGRRFTDVTARAGVGDTGWTMAVAAADVDGDGDMDLGVANDFGRKSLYINNNNGTFSESAREAGVLDFSGGMGLAFGDLDGDGRSDMYTSNIKSNQRWFGEDLTLNQYMRNVVRTRWLLADLGEYRELYRLLGPRWRELGKEVGEGNSLFHNKGDGTFAERKDSHANQAGWGWGVALFDPDNDGDLDLFAANGWVSNRPNTDL